LIKKIATGVNLLADNVGATLGPKGRNVILQKAGERPVITKDGVTVASFVDADDPFENLGIQVVKQASQVTAEEAGDGTTTSTMIARGIVEGATKHLIAGVSPTEIKRGMDFATTRLIESLSQSAKPLTSFEQVNNIAVLSANGDEKLGGLIAQAIDQVGKHGAIQIEPANSQNTTLELIEGFQFDSGYLSKTFVTDRRRWTMRQENALVLVYDGVVSSVEELFPVLQLVAREGRALTIVAEDVKDQALAALITNVTRGSMKVAAVRAPGYGEERRACLNDLALSVGGVLMGPAHGTTLKGTKLTDLGQAYSIEAKKNWCTFVGGHGDPDVIEERINNLKEEILQTDDMKECDSIQRRINRLASGIGIIKVGGSTEIEMMEALHRADDALKAVKSAQEQGVIAGGGVALLNAVEVISQEDFTSLTAAEQVGVQIIFDACAEPVRQMSLNAGLSPDIMINDINSMKQGYGYNFFTDEGNIAMMDEGIIDPVKVTKSALINAVSAAGTLITTSHGIVETI
jgi:chaperonin GroEL